MKQVTQKQKAKTNAVPLEDQLSSDGNAAIRQALQKGHTFAIIPEDTPFKVKEDLLRAVVEVITLSKADTAVFFEGWGGQPGPSSVPVLVIYDAEALSETGGRAKSFLWIT